MQIINAILLVAFAATYPQGPIVSYPTVPYTPPVGYPQSGISPYGKGSMPQGTSNYPFTNGFGFRSSTDSIVYSKAALGAIAIALSFSTF